MEGTDEKRHSRNTQKVTALASQTNLRLTMDSIEQPPQQTNTQYYNCPSYYAVVLSLFFQCKSKKKEKREQEATQIKKLGEESNGIQ